MLLAIFIGICLCCLLLCLILQHYSLFICMSECQTKQQRLEASIPPYNAQVRIKETCDYSRRPDNKPIASALIQHHIEATNHRNLNFSENPRLPPIYVEDLPPSYEESVASLTNQALKLERWRYHSSTTDATDLAEVTVTRTPATSSAIN